MRFSLGSFPLVVFSLEISECNDPNEISQHEGDRCIQIATLVTLDVVNETDPDGILDALSSAFDRALADGSFLRLIPEASRGILRGISAADEVGSSATAPSLVPAPAAPTISAESLVGEPSGEDEKSSNAAGIAAGVTIAVAFAALGFFVIRRRRSRSMRDKEEWYKDGGGRYRREVEDDFLDGEGKSKQPNPFVDEDDESSSEDDSSSEEDDDSDEGSSSEESSGDEESGDGSSSSGSYASEKGRPDVVANDRSYYQQQQGWRQQQQQQQERMYEEENVARAVRANDVHVQSAQGNNADNSESTGLFEHMDSGSSVDKASLVEEGVGMEEEMDSDSDHGSQPKDDDYMMDHHDPDHPYYANVDLMDHDGLTHGHLHAHNARHGQGDPRYHRIEEGDEEDDEGDDEGDDDSSAGSSGWESSEGESSSTNTGSVESFDPQLNDLGSSTLSRTTESLDDEIDLSDQQLLPATINPAVNPVVQRR